MIEEVLLKSNIEYNIVGGTRFYDRKEIKDLLAYLRLIANPDDDISLMRVINVPKRGIGSTSIDKSCQYALDNDLSMNQALNEIDFIGLRGKAANEAAKFHELIRNYTQMQEYLSVTELVEEVIEKSGYKEMLSLKSHSRRKAGLKISMSSYQLQKALKIQ